MSQPSPPLSKDSVDRDSLAPSSSVPASQSERTVDHCEGIEDLKPVHAPDDPPAIESAEVEVDRLDEKDCPKATYPVSSSDTQDGGPAGHSSLQSINRSEQKDDQTQGDHDAGPTNPGDPPNGLVDPLPTLLLHDCVSLGEIELGLDKENRAGEEIQCLPLLLRLLSLTRPLSTVEILNTIKYEKSNPTSPSGGDNESGGEPLVNGLVARLEHVAATHSMAEGVDVVTCHLAPSMSRKLSKLPPLSKKPDGTWDTAALSSVARNPIPSSRGIKRRRLSAESASNQLQTQQSDDGIEGSSEDDDEPSMVVEDQVEASSSNKKRRIYSIGGKRDSFGPGDGMAAEDSQEATFTKTLSELTSLVVSSLEALPAQDTTANVEEAQQSEQPQTRVGQFSLTIDDSILAEAGAGSDEGVGGAMARSDLGSTVASIMHHSPVLRSRHVANALCRAALPQAGDLLKRMGANCPPSIPCLLRGCTDAYSSAIYYGNASIATVAKKGVLALSQLSPRERSRVQGTLLRSYGGSMVDVQLELALEAQDSTSVCCLLCRNLSVASQVRPAEDELPSSQTHHPKKEQEMSKQATGATPSSSFRHHLEREYNPTVQGREPSLRQQLFEHPCLLENTLEFLVTELQSIAQADTETCPLGSLCLKLTSTVWLLLAVSPKNNLIFSRNFANFSAFLVNKMIPELENVSRYLKSRVPKSDPVPEFSSMDRAFCLVWSAIIVAWARFLPHDEADATKAENNCSSVVQDMQTFPSFSRASERFIDGIIWFTMKEDTSGLLKSIVELLCNSDYPRQQQLVLNMHYPTTELGLKIFCKHVDSRSPDNKTEDHVGEKVGSVSVRLATLLLETQVDCQSGSDAVAARVTHLLKQVLTDDDIGIDFLICSDEVAKFVVHATSYLARPSVQTQVPAVLHVQVEALGSRLEPWRLRDEETSLNQPESQYLLQLLHAFEFMDVEPQSPFVFFPRALPIRHAVHMCRHLASQGKARFLTSRLQEQIQKHLPDIYLDAQIGHSSTASPTNLSEKRISRQEICESLVGKIRACLTHHDTDKHASSLEGFFLLARAQLPDSDLAINVASALLASPNKPPPFFTYALLCEDPLVLLKCPMKVWHCRGLRRITLALLCSLLEANAYLVLETSPSESSADELLAARNAVVLRCLLIAISGVDSRTPAFYCAMTTSVIRWLVVSQRGLVAMLIRQGLPDTALDWLIEIVPETMSDSQDLIHLASDRSSLTPAERLVAADAVLRIAIAHGHNNEVEAQGMAYTALTQLVNCFFLVVGPVGVPVNALVGDGSGLDVTQISRNAAFRILKSLLKVRGKRDRLRNECGMALQKLANLCKGETVFSGVAGAVAGRRKTLLKEIFDAVLKASNSMGSSIGSQSAAA